MFFWTNTTHMNHFFKTQCQMLGLYMLFVLFFIVRYFEKAKEKEKKQLINFNNLRYIFLCFFCLQKMNTISFDSFVVLCELFRFRTHTHVHCVGHWPGMTLRGYKPIKTPQKDGCQYPAILILANKLHQQEIYNCIVSHKEYHFCRTYM